jgi:hypothetical protein
MTMHPVANENPGKILGNSLVEKGQVTNMGEGGFSAGGPPPPDPGYMTPGEHLESGYQSTQVADLVTTH